MANARTDDARAADVIKNWIRNRYTIELLGTWEIIHNPDFKVVEFDHFKSQAGLPSFVMSVSDWVEKMTKDSPSSKSSAFGSVFAPSAAKMQETRNKMHAASVYLLENLHFLQFFLRIRCREVLSYVKEIENETLKKENIFHKFIYFYMGLLGCLSRKIVFGDRR